MTNKDDWKTDFDWTDPNDVQLETVKENCKIKDGELGPKNEEACKLMDAKIHLLERKSKPMYDDDFDWADADGVGKDVYGLYSFTIMPYEGKKYIIQVREKDTYDVGCEVTRGRVIGPKLLKERLQ